MLKARKRISRRQIKEDKLVTYYFKVTDYLQQNYRNLVWGAVAVVIVLLALFIYTRRQQESENKAVVALMEAKEEYSRGNYEAATEKLQNLVETYGGTNSGKVGLFYLADANFKLERYDQARQRFQQYLDDGDDEILKASAAAGVAACLEEQGQFAEAADQYKEAATRFAEGFAAPDNLMSAARCYKLAGNTAAAKEVLQTLIEKYSSSPVKSEAEVFLAMLNS